MACAPQAVREAEDVVAQADSLWHAGKQYGIDEGDSATLAQAYKTLEAIPLPFREGLGLGSPYAHTCYHYGKLLRAESVYRNEKDYPQANPNVKLYITYRNEEGEFKDVEY